LKLLDRAESQKEEIRPDVAWGIMIDFQEVRSSSGVGVLVVGKIEINISGSSVPEERTGCLREPIHQRLEAAGEGLSE
jgi:hypothetical protein